jgi:COMPASS component SWD3
MRGHSSYVYCVTSHPVSRTVLSGGYDGSVMTFDATSGSCISAFSAHTEAISSIKYNVYADNFVTGSEDGFVRLWDSASNAGCIHTIYTETRSPM